MKIHLMGLFMIGALTIASTEALASKYGYLILDALSIDGENPETIVLTRTGLSMPRSEVIQLSVGNPFVKLEAGHYKFLRVDFAKTSSIRSRLPIATGIDFYVYPERINYLGQFLYDPGKKKHKDRLTFSDDTGLLKITCNEHAEEFNRMPIRFSMSNMPKQDFQLECEGFVIKPIESNLKLGS